MRMTVAIPVGAVLGGLACQRYDYRYPAVLGLALAAVGFGFMSRWGLDIADPAMGAHLAVSGLGFGLLIAPIALVATNAVETGFRGAAAALMRAVGEPLGLSAEMAAYGVIEMVDETMANAARVHAIERGKVIADHTIIAFGGAVLLTRSAGDSPAASSLRMQGAQALAASFTTGGSLSTRLCRTRRHAAAVVSPSPASFLMEAAVVRNGPYRATSSWTAPAGRGSHQNSTGPPGQRWSWTQPRCSP